MRTIFCILFFVFLNVRSAHSEDVLLQQYEVGIIHVNCYGESTGSISLWDVIVTGKEGIKSYCLTDADGIQVPDFLVITEPASVAFHDLMAGTYRVRIDIADESIFTDEIVVEQPDLLGIVSIITMPSCHNSANGTVAITISGGEAPYTFTVNEFPPNTQSQLSYLAFGLSSGTHHVNIVDVNECSIDRTFTVNSFPIFTATAAQTRLVRCDDPPGGEITVSVVPPGNGWDELMYKLEGSDTWQESPVFHDLEEDDYAVTVVDGNDCEVTTNKVTLRKAQTKVTATGSNVQCRGGFGTIDATAIVEDDLDDDHTPGEIEYFQLYMGSNSDPYSDEVNTGFFPELSAESYTVHVKDSYGCVHTAGATVFAPAGQLGLDLKDTQPPHGSMMGSITITARGGWGGYTIVCNKIGPGSYLQEVTQPPRVDADDYTYSNLDGYHYQFLISDRGGCFTFYVIDLDQATGETDLVAPNLKIYPNPSGDGLFFIEWDGVDDRKVTIEVFNMNQQLVYKTNAQTGAQTVIDVSNQSSGVYLLRVAELNIRQRIIIQ